MAVSTTQLKKLQEQVKKLRSENVRLKRELRKFSGKKSIRQNTQRASRQRRIETIRQAARRNAMTEDEAMSLALDAQHAPSQ